MASCWVLGPRPSVLHPRVLVLGGVAMASRTMWEGLEEVSLRARPWSRPIHTTPCRSAQAPLRAQWGPAGCHALGLSVEGSPEPKAWARVAGPCPAPEAGASLIPERLEPGQEGTVAGQQQGPVWCWVEADGDGALVPGCLAGAPVYSSVLRAPAPRSAILSWWGRGGVLLGLSEAREQSQAVGSGCFQGGGVGEVWR